jgi:hypothetical protein
MPVQNEHQRGHLHCKLQSSSATVARTEEPTSCTEPTAISWACSCTLGCCVPQKPGLLQPCNVLNVHTTAKMLRDGVYNEADKAAFNAWLDVVKYSA